MALAAQHAGRRHVTPAEDPRLLRLVDRRLGPRARSFRFTPEAIFSLSSPDDAERAVGFMRSLLPPLAGLALAEGAAGVGGNTLAFARAFRRVVAVELDGATAEALRSNLGLAGAENVEVREGDFAALAGRLDCDAVFLDPPWGGAGYRAAPRVGLRAPPGSAGAPEGLAALVARTPQPVFLKLPAGFDLGRFPGRPTRALQLRKYQLVAVGAAPKLKSPRPGKMAEDAKSERNDHRCGLLHHVEDVSEEAECPRFVPVPGVPVPINMCDPNEEWGSVMYAKTEKNEKNKGIGDVWFIKTRRKGVYDAWLQPKTKGVIKLISTARLRGVNRGTIRVQVARPIAALEAEEGKKGKLSAEEGKKSKPPARRKGGKPKAGKSGKAGARADKGAGPLTEEKRPEEKSRDPAPESPAPVADARAEINKQIANLDRALDEARKAFAELLEADQSVGNLDPQAAESLSLLIRKTAAVRMEAKDLADADPSARLPPPGAVPEGYRLLPETYCNDAVLAGKDEKNEKKVLWEGVGHTDHVPVHGDEIFRLVYEMPPRDSAGAGPPAVEAVARCPQWTLDAYDPPERA